MTKTAILALALVVAVALISPQQLPVIVYKVGLVLLAGVAGYILDRALFPYGRPHLYLPPRIKGLSMSSEVQEVPSPDSTWSDRKPFWAAQARRALIVAAAMLAVGLGL
jgi:hypothetical protein